MRPSQTKKQKNLIKLGTIWQLGKHRLAYGDARSKDLISKLVGNEKVNLICSDIPYGVAAVESKQNFKTLYKNKEIAGDQLQTDEEYKKFNAEWLQAVIPYLAQKNSAYIFNADKMLFSLRDALFECGFKISQLLIWVKSQSVVGRLDYAPGHELILYAWHGTHKFLKTKDRSVLFYPRPAKNSLHPTQKPTALIRRLILNSSSVDGLVYDGFVGSGTTLLVCEQILRRCIAIDIDLEYCQTTIKRWESMTGLKAKKIYEPEK